MAKAAHREVVQYRDLLLLQKVFISLLVLLYTVECSAHIDDEGGDDQRGAKDWMEPGRRKRV